MKTFEYTAVDAKGTRREGRMWSSDEAELDRQLEREGLTLMKAGEVRTARARKRFRIKSRDLLAFTAQLGTVTAAGVPLVEGLQGIGKRASSSDVGGLMDDMVSDLEAGESLSKAMERHPRAFPGVYRASVEAGEASGALDLVLGRLGGYLEWTQSMRSTTVQALIYPMILCFAILGLILILLYFVLPRIMGIFPGGPEDLPAQTRFVLAASDFLRANGLVLLGVGIASAISFAVSFRTPGGKRFFHGLLLRVPKLGMVLAKIATSRFASTASTLQAAGCDVFKVLRIAGATCGNAAMAAGFERATERVRNGQTIADALEDARGVDPLLIQMVAVGEKTGRLDDCLNRVVEYYDQEVPRAVKRFISILEPLLLVVAGGVVAFILLAALMPIFKLYESL